MSEGLKGAKEQLHLFTLAAWLNVTDHNSKVLAGSCPLKLQILHGLVSLQFQPGRACNVRSRQVFRNLQLIRLWGNTVLGSATLHRL